MKRVKDSGWILDKASSRPSRGIEDFDRTITYDKTLTDSEIELEKNELKNNNCPGLWGVYCQKSKIPFTYIFRTTKDTSG